MFTYAVYAYFLDEIWAYLVRQPSTQQWDSPISIFGRKEAENI